MRELDPQLLARLIIREAVPPLCLQKPLPVRVRTNLTLLISHGIGVMRHGGVKFVVLRSVLEADQPGAPGFRPTLLMHYSPNKLKRKTRPTTGAVAGMRANLGYAQQQEPSTVLGVMDGAWFQVINEWGGEVTLQPQAVTTDDTTQRRIRWYNMADVAIGTTVICVGHDPAKPERSGVTVGAYQLCAPDTWGRAEFDGTADVIDLPAALDALRGDGEPFTTVLRLEGQVPLLKSL